MQPDKQTSVYILLYFHWVRPTIDNDILVLVYCLNTLNTKWLPFYRQHFSMDFPEWKYVNFDQDFIEVWKGSN